MFGRFKRKRAAARYGVPFIKTDFWPPFYLMMGQEVAPGVRCIDRNQKLYAAKVGDVVPAIETDTVEHHYRLTAWSRKSGDDHIVSPKTFDLEYDHSSDKNG